jgi:monovalent cation:H+ antiporter-2, CPA2 family
MHDVSILVNITTTLCIAFVGGVIARYLKLPTLVGYLLAGVVIGPFTPGFFGDIHTIEQLAELGVIFLLFGVGLHFSLRDLWAVRAIAIPGALLQMGITTLFGVLLARWWNWSLPASLVLGLAISIASTVVLLRNLIDHGLLNTSHGQVAVGWLVLEDLATVLILVLLPAFFTNTTAPLWQTAGLALLKTAVFAVLMLFVGIRVIPWLLLHIAHLQSRELFIVAVVVITLGIAVGATSFFGISLALGAFLSGVVVNESALSHQVEAEILPFREVFAVLFFVSIGMLVNPMLLLTHSGEVLALVALIVLGKTLIVLLLGLFFTRPAYTILVIAVALSQIGEFSFLLGQTGVNLHLLTQEQYSLLLMGSLISITLSPFMFRLLPWLKTSLQQFHTFWSLLDRHAPIPEIITESLQHHVVIVGYGRVGQHLVTVLSHLNIPLLVIELDAGRVQELAHLGIPTLYGDAANSEILSHASLSQARAVVITLPDEAAATSATAAIHDMAPHVPLMVRAITQEHVQRLFSLGASEVIYPELEGGLALVYQTLVHLGYPEYEIQQYTEAVRRDHYDISISSPAEQDALAHIRSSIKNSSPSSENDSPSG